MEFEAFEALQERVEDLSSPLHGARLLPNLYMPCKLDGRHPGRLWDQIDLVVAAKSCAFVVEVKRRSASVRMSVPFDTVFVGGGEADGRPFEDAGWMLDQNATHAMAFSDAVKEYPYERVYEVLLFVRPRSFETDAEGFSGNIFVGCASEFTRDLEKAMGAVMRDEQPKMSQEELERFTDERIARYGDLNQMRCAIHVRRIRSLAG